MSAELVAIVVLVVVFLVGTVRPINMGALGLVAAAVVGPMVFDTQIKDVLKGFPASLFVTLVGVTYLFALARNNGTIDWIVHSAVTAVRGRVALVPWVMFGVCAVLTAVGAVSPAAVAIVSPIAMGFAKRFGIHPLVMGMCVVQGATAGSFSPIGIFGSITNGVVERSHLEGNRVVLFVSTFLAALAIALITYLALGRRTVTPAEQPVAVAGAAAAGGVGDPGDARATGSPPPSGRDTALEVDELVPSVSLNAERGLTIFGIVFLAITALFLSWDVGFVSLGIGVFLTLVFPDSGKGAVDKVAWSTVLLICGIVTYVGLLESKGVVKWLGDGVATLGTPLMAGLLICLIGSVVSAFASTTGILGALIPLAVPFLMTGQLGAVGLIAALSVSSSTVDCSPFSTNGALIVANADPGVRDATFRGLMRWGMSIVVIAPIVAWAVLVVPGWLG